MKARGAAMTKGALAEALATQMDLKKSVCGKVIGTLAEIGAGEVKSTGIFTLPGLCRIKTRVKPATKAGKNMMFGKEVMVKVKPAKTSLPQQPQKQHRQRQQHKLRKQQLERGHQER